MNPSDENLQGKGLGEFSKRLSQTRDETVELWKSTLKSDRRMKGIRHEHLIDTFPVIFDDLMQALTSDYPRELATSGTNLAEAHGSERANNTFYDACDVVDELQKFRSAILSIAEKHNIVFSNAQMNVVLASFDKLIVDSLVSFSQEISKDKDFYIATFTHDLRSPIHTANASAQLISLQTNKATIAKLAKQISFSLGEAGTMIEDLLDSITVHKRKKIALDISFFEIEDLVVEAVNEAKLKGSVVIYQTVPMKGFLCRPLLKRAIINLLSNAQKYSFEKNSVTINLSRFEERVLISVHNFGVPIPSSAIGRIFDLLERSTDSQLEGWGIGLPLVKLVAESHGGVIIVDSDAKRGTTFSLNLPLDSRGINTST